MVNAETKERRVIRDNRGSGTVETVGTVGTVGTVRVTPPRSIPGEDREGGQSDDGVIR